MLSLEDLCPGWIEDQRAPQGRCCCGLHWTGHMPPHDAKGTLAPPYVIERLRRRVAERDQVEARRAAERLELEQLRRGREAEVLAAAVGGMRFERRRGR